MAIEITIVAGASCPGCGAGDEWHNRPKVADAEGVWWWRCYNPICEVRYYDPETGTVEAGGIGKTYITKLEEVQR